MDPVCDYIKLKTRGYSCCYCGNRIEPDDNITVCADCGDVFCKACVENGSFDDHECEEEEYEED